MEKPEVGPTGFSTVFGAVSSDPCSSCCIWLCFCCVGSLEAGYSLWMQNLCGSSYLHLSTVKASGKTLSFFFFFPYVSCSPFWVLTAYNCCLSIYRYSLSSLHLYYFGQHGARVHAFNHYPMVLLLDHNVLCETQHWLKRHLEGDSTGQIQMSLCSTSVPCG